MANGRATCAHCGAPIVDPTTQVVNSELVFCCPNCSAAMEQRGSGSGPHSHGHANALRCARCGVPIVHERSRVGQGDRVFCCANCEAAARGQDLPRERVAG